MHDPASGSAASHPMQWPWASAEEKRRIQETWDRFLLSNPNHRALARETTRRPCIIHNLAEQRQAAPCVARCLTPKLYQELVGYLDHEEPWQCLDETGTARDVLFGHPYLSVGTSYVARLQEFLSDLPGRAGEKLAIYVSEDDDSWYRVPTSGIFIQHRTLPAIARWREITITEG